MGSRTESDTQCKSCSAGQYSEAGETTCHKCEPGKFRPQHHGPECQDCAEGQYQDSLGGSECKTCNRGHYQDALKQHVCRACPVGKYVATPGARSCAICPGGKLQPKPASYECEACDAGQFAAVWSGYDPTQVPLQCQLCPPGKYQALSGKGFCTPCAQKHYQIQSGKLECKECPAGKYQSCTGGLVVRQDKLGCEATMPPTPAPEPVEVIEVSVTLDKETVEGFNDARQIQFISGVAKALGVSEAQIAIARVEPLGIDAARRRLADGAPVPGSSAMKLGIKVFLQIKMSKHSETASVITVMESPSFTTKLSDALKQQQFEVSEQDLAMSAPVTRGMKDGKVDAGGFDKQGATTAAAVVAAFVGALLVFRFAKRRWDLKKAFLYKQQHAAHGKDHFESDPIVPGGAGGHTPAAGGAGTLAVVDSSNSYDAGTV